MSATPHERFCEAYLRMARLVRYRPQAPSDGYGHIQLTVAEVKDPARLAREATTYAAHFIKEENTGAFQIGCSNYSTNRAFMWTIEAARNLAAGDGGTPTAFKLLKMALEELKPEVGPAELRNARMLKSLRSGG